MRLYGTVKRLLDFLSALILLILVSPIMLVTAVVIKIESEGPALFIQNRPGKNAKIFRVFKFRTMKVQTEENGKPLSDVVRMTRIGPFLRRTSVDELPQLFNILRGEMSFIGPRPLLVQYLEHYSTEQMRRHEVTPGISGWAQVNGRNAISWEQKFRYDVWYVDNQSALLDFKIVYLTIFNIMYRKDINNTLDDTMPIFTRDKRNVGMK